MNTTLNPNYKISKIDNIFFGLFGYYPSKEGKSYEMLVGAVLKIIYNKKIILDEFKIGNYDYNKYQIDASIYDLSTSIMVEAKDYSNANKKVSRPDIDKIAGSLLELDFNEGFFFSATDFTKDAKRKVNASKINPRTTKLSLYHLSPSNESDLKGRLMKITLNIIRYELDKSETIFTPNIPAEDFNSLIENSGLLSSNLKCATELNYDENSLECTGMFFDKFNNEIGKYHFNKELDRSIFQMALANNFSVYGKWIADNAYLYYSDNKIKIDTISYKIKFNEISTPLYFESTGEPILKIISEDGQIDKLITSTQLKSVIFEQNGEISVKRNFR